MFMEWIRNLTIQWHITTRCDNNCRHCYVQDKKTIKSEIEKGMNLGGLMYVLKSIIDFEKIWKADIRNIFISGGDPLLHDDWKAFLWELKAHNKRIFIFGNPENLSEENLAYLKKVGVFGYQMSLDGLEEYHDSFRSKGSFKRTVNAIDKLRKFGILAHIMFTLYPENKDEFIPLLNFVATKTNADVFNFDIGAFTGNAESFKARMTAREIREILNVFYEEKQRLKNAGYRIRIFEKSTMFRLLRFEKSFFYPFSPTEIPAISGCLCGWTSISIISDGHVLACRRGPSIIGKMPEMSFSEIFLKSEIIKKFRRAQFYKECGKCIFYKHCRGCPTAGYGITNDLFAPYPHCFRNFMTGRTNFDYKKEFESITMDTSMEEERELIAGHFSNVFYNRREKILECSDVRKAIEILSVSENERKAFFHEPDSFLKKNRIKLSELERLFVSRLLKPRNMPVSICSRCGGFGH